MSFKILLTEFFLNSLELCGRAVSSKLSGLVCRLILFLLALLEFGFHLEFLAWKDFSHVATNIVSTILGILYFM